MGQEETRDGDVDAKAGPFGVAALMVTGGAGVAMAGEPANAFACGFQVNVPNSSNDAQVGRIGCSNLISGTGYIKEDRNGIPDSTVGVRTFNAGLATVNGNCGNGRGSYYSQFNSSSGGTAQSSRATRC